MIAWPTIVMVGAAFGAQSQPPLLAHEGPPFTSFCRKTLLVRDGGELRCNWYGSFEAACEFVSPDDLVVQAAAVLDGPEPVGRCGSGEEIVRVHYQ
jgi:hypothetical protein